MIDYYDKTLKPAPSETEIHAKIIIVRRFVERIIEFEQQFAVMEAELTQKCMEILHAKNILAISGIGETTLAGI